MFFEQGLVREIVRRSPPIRVKALAQERLDILDPAASPEDLRFINQLDRMPAITSCREEFLEDRREMVRVDDKRFYARCDEMIEGEGDERLLKNGDQWLRQHLAERAHPQAQAGAEDEGLGNHFL